MGFVLAVILWAMLGPCACGVARAEGGVTTVDYAAVAHVDDWLRHAVLGDPSFDAFERDAGNPIRRGKPPFEWPVNGFFFRDPVSGNWYVYAGDYAKGYLGTPARCWLLRSRDAGKTWQDVGEVLPRNDLTMFDSDGKRSGYMPDVSVAYDPRDRRYHMLYDWSRPEGISHDSGIAYAVADRPEGPFVRDREPIQVWKTTKLILGRYNRPYAQTIIRRKDDWLVLADMDHAPQSWAMYAMTAKHARGPYGEPVLVRHVESDYFHPPLMEGYPAFVHDGYVYAPATSVARNRNFNCIFRAPIEKAHEESAWSLVRHGSVWHAQDVEHEFHGIWGQTFSGFVDDADSVLHAMFCSRDANGLGTISLARRRWDTPLKSGFHISGHDGPSITLLRRTYRDVDLDVECSLRGRAAILWDHNGPLGPHAPTSDATLGASCLTRHAGLRLDTRRGDWEVYQADEVGRHSVLAGAKRDLPNVSKVHVSRRGREITIVLDGQEIWRGTSPGDGGGIGLWADADTHLGVRRFEITGTPRPASRAWTYLEALLGHGESLADWQVVNDDARFHFKFGAISKSDGATVKWNVVGKRFHLWSPTGPAFGTVEIRVDGKRENTIDLAAAGDAPAHVVWSSDLLQGDAHAIVMRSIRGRCPVDTLIAED